MSEKTTPQPITEEYAQDVINAYQRRRSLKRAYAVMTDNAVPRERPGKIRIDYGGLKLYVDRSAVVNAVAEEIEELNEKYKLQPEPENSSIREAMVRKEVKGL